MPAVMVSPSGVDPKRRAAAEQLDRLASAIVCSALTGPQRRRSFGLLAVLLRADLRERCRSGPSRTRHGPCRSRDRCRARATRRLRSRRDVLHRVCDQRLERLSRTSAISGTQSSSPRDDRVELVLELGGEVVVDVAARSGCVEEFADDAADVGRDEAAVVERHVFAVAAASG